MQNNAKYEKGSASAPGVGVKPKKNASSACRKPIT